MLDYLVGLDDGGVSTPRRRPRVPVGTRLLPLGIEWCDRELERLEHAG